jgi:hypothetical protein
MPPKVAYLSRLVAYKWIFVADSFNLDQDLNCIYFERIQHVELCPGFCLILLIFSIFALV